MTIRSSLYLLVQAKLSGGERVARVHFFCVFGASMIHAVGSLVL